MIHSLALLYLSPNQTSLTLLLQALQIKTFPGGISFYFQNSFLECSLPVHLSNFFEICCLVSPPFLTRALDLPSPVLSHCSDVKILIFAPPNSQLLERKGLFSCIWESLEHGW